MVAQNPNDPFLRYGLAMEYRNGGDLEASISEFRLLIEANPDYAAAYQHGAQVLVHLGRTEEARSVYRAGIAVAARKGDRHARDEMQAALDLLG